MLRLMFERFKRTTPIFFKNIQKICSGMAAVAAMVTYIPSEHIIWLPNWFIPAMWGGAIAGIFIAQLTVENPQELKDIVKDQKSKDPMISPNPLDLNQINHDLNNPPTNVN